MNKKITIFVLIIIFILIAGIAYFYTPLKVMFWPKFKETDFRMSFKYPNNWFININGGEGDMRVTASNMKGQSTTLRPGETLIAFEVSTNKDNLNINDIVSCNDLGKLAKLTDCSTEKVDNYIFKKDAHQKNDSGTMHLGLIKDGYIYQIEVFGDLGDSSIKPVLNSISLN